MEILFVLGRIILGGFFAYNAYNHLANTAGLAGYAKAKNVPMPKTAVIVSGLLLVFGSFSILTGIWVKAGIAALVLFLIPITFTMHAFWKDEGQDRAFNKIQFGKNLAILGALLMLLSVPTPWTDSFGGF